MLTNDARVFGLIYNNGIILYNTKLFNTNFHFIR